jgi:Fe-S-cluster-containing hydrogenase component 2
MELLPLTAEEIVSHLANPSPEATSRRIPKQELSDLGAPPRCVGAGAINPLFDAERRGVHFFKIQYKNDEIIMPAGIFSDFAGVLLQGKIRVLDGKLAISEEQRAGAECRNRPGWLFHRLEQFILDRTDRSGNRQPQHVSWWAKAERMVLNLLRKWPVGSRNRWVSSLSRRWHEQQLARPVEVGQHALPAGVKEVRIVSTHQDTKELPVFERFVGVSSALWNLPRSYNLVAAPDEHGQLCEMLLIKREVFENIEERDMSPFLLKRLEEKFLDQELPSLLCENRLFRHLFYESDILDWPQFLRLLRGVDGTSSKTLAGLRSLLDPDFQEWLVSDSARDPTDRRVRYRVLSGLNEMLKRPGAWKSVTWPDHVKPAVDAFLHGRNATEISENAIVHLNHLLVESAFGPDIVPPCAVRPPLERQEFEALLKDLRNNPAGGVALKHFKIEQVILEEEKPADALHLVIAGKVRVTKSKGGDPILVNQLDRFGFLGVSWFQPGAKHSATVTAASTEVHTIEFTGTALDSLRNHPFLKKKLAGEYERIRLRDQLLETIERLPPAEPPEAIASKLLAGHNLLRIDMDLCTRCDQCVAACAEAHDGVSRFHRANPKLRFGKWEITRACVHCDDAPCQHACPVGAITFLDDGIVQLHRSRCIGCRHCPPACPFDAIEMTPPRFDVFQMGDQEVRDIAPNNDNRVIANKCDLCLAVNRDPPCVVSCPYGAAQRGAPRALFPNIKSWADLLRVS